MGLQVKRDTNLEKALDKFAAKPVLTDDEKKKKDKFLKNSQNKKK
ncbi:SPJ_0845 family protein [Pediococcus claussenii]|nr:SPJ_0845 family protein [Pediococcus claussenii]